jgi:O-antigen/teichoic acid export membrane protein
LHFADRILLRELSGDEGQTIVGIYGHGYKIAFLVTNMLLGPFIQIWQPWIFAIENPRERSALVARVGTYAVLTIATASLGVILFGRQGAILLAGRPGFYEAYKAIPWIAAGYVFWALYHVAQTVLFISKRTGRIVTINIVAVGVNLITCVFLIPIFGFEGAAMATLLTFAAIAVMMVVAARADSQVPFEHGRLIAILACVLAGGAFSLWIDGMEADDRLSMWYSVPIKAGFYLAAVGVFWGRILSPAERERFRQWLKRRLGRET